MKNANHNFYHTTAVYRGKSYVMSECMIGRLSFWKRDRRPARKECATIAILTSETVADYLAICDHASSTVAVIFIGEDPSESLCQYAGTHELPLLILGKLSLEHDGKVAILDSRTATLLVDPDLGTLERYARSLRFCGDPALFFFPPSLRTHYAALSLCTPSFPLLSHGKMLSDTESGPLTTAYGEEALFEALCTFAEDTVGIPLILPVHVYDLHTEQSVTALQMRLRALLRAAVFGSFSLLFEGLYNAHSAKLAFSVLDGVCRELSAEGREYDACIPCGIAVESLLLLHELGDCPLVHYVCLDWDRLLRAALPPLSEKTPSLDAKESLLALFCQDARACTMPICLRTVHTPAVHAWKKPELERCGIQTVFVPSDHTHAWQEWLDEK